MFKFSISLAFEKLIVVLSLTRIQCISYNPNKGDSMAKGKDVQKSVKKKSEKTLKEKRAEKKAKKNS
jgi:hypothetical protein